MSEYLNKETFSKKRAIRGFVTGFIVGTIAAEAGILFSGETVSSSTYIVNSLHPLEHAISHVLETGFLGGGIGALIDMYHPTSKLTEKFIQSQMQYFKSAKDSFIKNRHHPM